MRSAAATRRVRRSRRHAVGGERARARLQHRVTAFFVPGTAGDALASESTYEEMRRETELEMGHRPSSRRILSVWTRRGSVDCVTEVGRGDPLRGGTVIAIFDMGAHQPFVVWWQQAAGSGERIREILGCEAYSVLEFEA